jgi:hypothetical protein
VRRRDPARLGGLDRRVTAVATAGHKPTTPVANITASLDLTTKPEG